MLVRGITIKCFCGPGPRLLVPVDTGDVDRIVQHLFTRAGELADTETSFAYLLSDNETGLIVWKSPPAAAASQGPPATAGSWQILYHNDQGQPKRTSQGLQVPARDLAGEVLSAEGLRDAASQVLLKARRLWNHSDCRDLPRLLEEVSVCGDGAAASSQDVCFRDGPLCGEPLDRLLAKTCMVWGRPRQGDSRRGARLGMHCLRLLVAGR